MNTKNWLRGAALTTVTTMGTITGLAHAYAGPGEASTDLLFRDYSSFMQGIETNDQVTDDDEARWVGRFEKAIRAGAGAQQRYAAWNAIISLHNARQHWDLSLSSIDEAIAATNSDEYLFEWQYDRWTVLQRLDPQEGAGLGEGGDMPSLSNARDEAIKTFSRIFDAAADDAAPLDGTPKFIALAYDALRDVSNPSRLDAGQKLVEVTRRYEGQMGITATAYANYSGYLAGLMLAQGPDGAFKLIETVDAQRDKLIAIILAMQTARQSAVPNAEINEFL